MLTDLVTVEEQKYPEPSKLSPSRRVVSKDSVTHTGSSGATEKKLRSSQHLGEERRRDNTLRKEASQRDRQRHTNT